MLWKLITRYGFSQWGLLIVVVGFQFVQSILSLMLPTINADIIDDGVLQGDTDTIWRLGGFMLLLSLGQIIANGIAVWAGARLAMGAGRRMRADVFGRVLDFSERDVQRFGAASLITRNTNDVQQVQMLLLMSCTMLVASPMLAIGGVVMALRADAQLSWLIAVAVPVTIVILAIFVSRLVPIFRLMQTRLDAINRIMREQLTGIRVVRAFVQERRETKRFNAANADLTKVMLQTGNIFVIMFPVIMLVVNISSVAVLWFGAPLVDSGELQIGLLMAFLQYLMQILFGVMMATFMTMMIPRAAVSAGRLGELLDAAPTIHVAENAVTQLPEPGRVRFEHVSFAYPGAEVPVLSDITFDALPGQTVAIIGSTGAGKTTLVNLVPRLFDATEGSVNVGGVDVKQADPDALWAQLGIVPQRPYLFSGTIASNLRYGNPDASDEQLWQALEIAQAADFVRAKDGQLESRIAQGGTNVSGGQRQRLAIARALVKRPPVLIFDDAFSALDLRTDARLRAALDVRVPEVTKLVVAQRVSSIQGADLILVLDDGRIVGSGTHEQLLQDNETYQEIVSSQLTAEAGR